MYHAEKKFNLILKLILVSSVSIKILLLVLHIPQKPFFIKVTYCSINFKVASDFEQYPHLILQMTKNSILKLIAQVVEPYQQLVFHIMNDVCLSTIFLLGETPLC